MSRFASTSAILRFVAAWAVVRYARLFSADPGQMPPMLAQQLQRELRIELLLGIRVIQDANLIFFPTTDLIGLGRGTARGSSPIVRN